MYVCMYIYNSVFIVASSNNFFFLKIKTKQCVSHFLLGLNKIK